MKILLLFGLSFLLNACDEAESPPVETPMVTFGQSCEDDSDCSGYSCVRTGRGTTLSPTRMICVESCDSERPLIGQCSGGRDCIPYASSPWGPIDRGICDQDGPVAEGGSCDPPSREAGTSALTDCALGLACVDGECRPICKASSPECEICLPFPPGGLSRLEPDSDFALGYCPKISGFGEECGQPDDCGTNGLCIRNLDDDGFECRHSCETPLTFCDDGSACGPIASESFGVCLNYGSQGLNESCSVGNECDSGLLCVVVSGEGYCRPFCMENSDCADSAFCRRQPFLPGGSCVERYGLDCGVDSLCDEGATCTTRIDLTLLTTFPRGYCSNDCTNDSDCGEAARCQDIGASSICLASCETDNDCNFPFGYRCFDSARCSFLPSADIATCRELVGDGSACLYGAD